jgi:hypothetical protein
MPTAGSGVPVAGDGVGVSGVPVWHRPQARLKYNTGIHPKFRGLIIGLAQVICTRVLPHPRTLPLPPLSSVSIRTGVAFTSPRTYHHNTMDMEQGTFHTPWLFLYCILCVRRYAFVLWWFAKCYSVFSGSLLQLILIPASFKQSKNPWCSPWNEKIKTLGAMADNRKSQAHLTGTKWTGLPAAGRNNIGFLGSRNPSVMDVVEDFHVLVEQLINNLWLHHGWLHYYQLNCAWPLFMPDGIVEDFV